MTKRRKTIEKPRGRGHIWLPNAEPIAVRYSLVVLQIVDEDVDTGHLAGRSEVRGSLDVSQDAGLIDLSARPFTLHTADGRCLEARANKGDPVGRQWEIIGTNPHGLVPC